MGKEILSLFQLGSFFSFYLFIIQSGSLSSFYLPNEDDLRNRKLEFRFDTGSGAAVLRSKEEVSNAH